MPLSKENMNLFLKNFMRLCGLDDKVSREPIHHNDFSTEETEVCFADSLFEDLLTKDLMNCSIASVLFMDKTKRVSIEDGEALFAQISTKGCHPGYMKLLLPQKESSNGDTFFAGCDFQATHSKEKSTEILHHKVQLAMQLDDISDPATDTVAPPWVPLDATVHNITGKITPEIKPIVGLLCPYWPMEATEWTTRQRKHNWPPRQTVEDIVALGCYLLPVPHQLSSDPEHEWLLYFAKAEKELSNLLGAQQRTCCLLMELLYQYHIKDLSTLSSYHMKMCFFWMCEQLAAGEWQEENLGGQLLLLLDDVIRCVTRVNLPNYFVPGNNMLDHLKLEDLRRTLETLQTIKGDIFRSLMPLLDIYNGSLTDDYDAIQAALDFTGVNKFTVHNHYTKPTGIFQQIMEPILSDKNFNEVDLEKQVLVSLGVSLSLIMTDRYTSSMAAFSDVIDGMQIMGLLSKEWNSRLSSSLVSSLLMETALGVPRSHISSVLRHVQELFSVHIRKSDKSEEILLAFTQSACVSVLHSHRYDNCDTVIDCLDALNQPLNYILRAAYSKVNKDEDGCKSSLQKLIRLESATLRKLVQIRSPSSRSTEGTAARFESDSIVKKLVNMAKQIAKEDRMKVNTLYITSGMYNDILLHECDYAGGILQVQIGLLAGLMLVNHTKGYTNLVLHALDKLTKPVTHCQWFLTGFTWYTLHQFTKAKKAFRETLKRNPGHIGAHVFGILCDAKQGLFSSNRKKSASTGQMTTSEVVETKYALNIYSLLDDQDIALLYSIFQIKDFADDKNNFLRVSLARHLQVASFLHIDREMILNYSDMAEKLLQMQSTSPEFNANGTLHYLYFLHRNNRLDELEHQLDNFPSNYFDFRDLSLRFHYTEKPILPDFISEALDQVDVVAVSAQLFSLYLKAELRQVKHLFQKVDLSILDSIPEILTQFDANTSVSIASKLSESLNLSLAGSILSRQCQYDNARSMFINALNRFPGTSPVVYQKIKNCEDKLMNQTVAYILQENFSEAYSTYCSLWVTCLPRCSADCSGILHLSEEILDMAQEDHRALQLSTAYLQYAIIQHKEMAEDNILHESHALAVLAYFEYMLSLKTLDGAKKQRLLQACEEHFLDAATSSNSGSLFTHLGNLLVKQEKHSQALPYLEKALELGIEMNTEQAVALPHELLSETYKFRMENYLPVDPIFQILVCFSEGHYKSFVVYALYLMVTCKLHAGEDPSSIIEALQRFCETRDFCEYSVLGLVFLNVGNYKDAAVHFEKEIQNGMFQKRKTMMEFMILSRCCLMLQDVCDPGALEELISEWIFMLESSVKEAVVIDSLNTVMYEAVGPISLGLYMATTLPRCLDMSDLATLDKVTEVYAFLQKELSGVDHLVDGMHTNLAILLSEKFMSLEDGPEREVIRQQATEAFKRALSSPDISLTTTKLAYAEFLLNQGKFVEAIEQSEMAAEMAREMIGGMLAQSIEDEEELSESDMQMIKFYLQSSLVPASDYLIIGHSVLHDFDKAFDAVDTLVAFLQRAQDLEVDPLVYLIKYIMDLPRFKASMDTVLSYYKAVVERYPASRFIPTIHNRMGCILFAHSGTLTDHTERTKYVQKAKESYQEALFYEDATMALYADYINFLYNIGEYEAALTCICESDNLPDSAKGSNSYGHDEMDCVDICIQQLIQSSETGRFITDSHFYVQYLRVTVMLALQKEETFIESEIQVLLEDGEDKHVDCVHMMCSYLTEQIKR